jgi:hypothetical protein
MGEVNLRIEQNYLMGRVGGGAPFLSKFEAINNIEENS